MGVYVCCGTSVVLAVTVFLFSINGCLCLFSVTVFLFSINGCLCLFYQLDKDNRRLLFIEKKRTMKSLLKCLRGLTRKQQQQVKFICSDMWKPYLKVIKKIFPQALNILDCFHIVKMLNKSIDEVRREEVKRLKENGYEPVLKNSKYCWLKNEENLTESQTKNLNDVLQYDLKTVRAYLLKESFQAFWQYSSPYWAQWFFKIMVYTHHAIKA